MTTLDADRLDGRQSALVAGDDPALRRLTSAILRQQGFFVTEVRSVVEVEQALESSGNSVALLIASLDVGEQRNVIDLALGLRDRHRRLKVILTSTASPHRFELEIMQGAGIGFLSLPFSFSRFSCAVRGVAARSPIPAGMSDFVLPAITSTFSHDLASGPSLGAH